MCKLIRFQNLNLKKNCNLTWMPCLGCIVCWKRQLATCCPVLITLHALYSLLFARYTFPYPRMRLLWGGLFFRKSVIFCMGTDSFSISTLIFNDFCLSHIIEFCAVVWGLRSFFCRWPLLFAFGLLLIILLSFVCNIRNMAWAPPFLWGIIISVFFFL